MDGSTALLLGAGTIVLLVVLVTALGLLRGPGALYARRDTFLSPREADVLRALDASVGEEFRVMAKVGVDALVQTRKRLPGKSRRYARDRILGTPFDYVLLDRKSLVPIVVLLVEAEDTPRRQRRRNAFLESLCRAVGLPLAVIDPAAAIDPDRLRGLIAGGVHPAAATTTAGTGRAEPTIAQAGTGA